MNLLSLISSWLDIICQITTKCATVPKLKSFRELNTTLIVLLVSFPQKSEQQADQRPLWFLFSTEQAQQAWAPIPAPVLTPRQHTCMHTINSHLFLTLCLIPLGKVFKIESFYIWTIKHTLITKLIIELIYKLRDEFIKTN